MSSVAITWLGLGLSLALGMGLALTPVWTVGIVGAVALLLALVILTWSDSFWRWGCLALLIGYVVLGRGFAYTSVPLHLLLPDGGQFPIYVGEIALLGCLLTMPHRAAWRQFASTASGRWLFPWLAAGAVLTIVNVPEYGVNALRDGATWYYAIFLYVGFAFASRMPEIIRLCRVLAVALLLHLLYSITYLLHLVYFEALPIMAPGSDFPLFGYRHDVSAVVFLGGVLFTLLLADRLQWRTSTRWLFAVPQFALFLALQKRSAYVALLLVTGALLVLRRFGPMLRIGAMAVLVLIAAISWGGELDLLSFGSSFKASPERVVEYVTTLIDFGGRARYRYQESESAIGTVEWRREYWEIVITDNLRDPWRFIVGRGFGPDLVTSTKYTFGGDRPNRNPHNIAITVLARMGLVGLVLWLGFYVAIFRELLAGIRRADRQGDAWSRDVCTFVLIYAVAVLGASLFSVMLETPFVAIPYYFLLGCGLSISVRQLMRRAPEKLSVSG